MMCNRLTRFQRAWRFNLPSAIAMMLTVILLGGCQMVSGPQHQTGHQQGQHSLPAPRTQADANVGGNGGVYSLGDTGNRNQAAESPQNLTASNPRSANPRPNFPAPRNQPHAASPIANSWQAAPIQQTAAVQPELARAPHKRDSLLTRLRQSVPGRKTTQNANAGTSRSKQTNPGSEFQRARQMEKQGQLNEAIGIYESLAQAGNQGPVLWHRLGVCYDKFGRTDLSLPYYQRALAMQPNNVDLLCDFGYRWYLIDNAAEAERYYREALRISPTHGRSHSNLAMLLAQNNRIDDAHRHFRNAGLSGQQANHNVSVAMQALNPSSAGHVSRR